MDRREFLKNAGLVILSVTVSEKIFAHEGHLTSLSEERDLLIVQSGPGRLVKWNIAHHHHYIEIPIKTLLNPPAEGIVVSTNWQFAHFHKVDISQEQLMRVRDGETVIVEDRVKDHEFHIELPR